MRYCLQRSNNDCFSACLASLLNFETDDVPNFGKFEESDKQMDAVNRWLKKMNYALVEVVLPKKTGNIWPHAHFEKPIYGILTVCWQGNHWTHAVIGQIKDNKMSIIHDPSGEKMAYGEKHRYYSFSFLTQLSV